jgi:ABC-type multidrug transport system fused ATPase/permease subunit
LQVVTLSLLAFGIQGFLDYFISFWVSNTFNLSSTTYLWIYSLLAVVSMLFYVSYLVGFWAYALRAARALHDLALDRLLRARVSWFESVPSGRILNRFSKDVDVVDQALPDSFKVFFGNVVQLLMFVVVISVAFPYFLVVVVPVTFLFFYITLYFNRTNRQVRRLEGVLRSPVFSDMSTLLTGLQTLRIYNQTEDFAKRLITRIDRFSR